MDILFVGYIEGIRYTETAVIVTASERKNGYRKKDGTIVDDEILTFKFIFKTYFKSYIAGHFVKGMLVKIKGIMFPYARDKNGNVIDGFSIIGQTIDIAPYPIKALHREKQIIKESMAKSDELPDIDKFTAPDF